MAETERIEVAEISAGPGGSGAPGETVHLPVVEVLTGRGFTTGKSGSGKSNTASVIAEQLLSANFPLLVVDTDGEYYGLKEQYELLHVGADDECDFRVGPEHAEKLANLALEENVPIILDISSYLDEDDARELLTAVARQLFAKEKKLKKPFLLIVEEIHEYIPEGAGLDECGQMLVKIGKRGRKHGLGIAGISQRPADVKKDFITQCDWLVWHRLTWDNDTDVVRRVLDSEYADAVEELDDGEAFLMTDWSADVRRVQFRRKRTFDAGATPGLDDFERPELKSVSDDLVSDLEAISEESERREDRIEELREELDRKNSRIAELEAELADARDMRRMADQFTEALLEQTRRENPGRTEAERMRARRESVDDPSNGSASNPAMNTEPSPPSVARSTSRSDRGAGSVALETGGNDDTLTGPEAEDPGFVRYLRAEIVSMEPETRAMLAYYREHGPDTPVEALAAAGGTGDRTRAYARNRTLRTSGLVEHVGRGRYADRLREAVAEEAAGELGAETVDRLVASLDAALRAGGDGG